MIDLVNLIRQAAQPRGTNFVHDLALDAAAEIERLQEVLKAILVEAGDGHLGVLEAIENIISGALGEAS